MGLDEFNEAQELTTDESNKQANNASPFIQTFHRVPRAWLAFFLDFVLCDAKKTITEQ